MKKEETELVKQLSESVGDLVKAIHYLADTIGNKSDGITITYAGELGDEVKQMAEKAMEDDAPTAPPEPAPPAPSKDDVHQALREFFKNNPREKLEAIMKQFAPSGKLDDVDPGDYANLIGALK